MAHVFRGKLAIPGDQMEAYFHALGQFEKDKEPLRTPLERCAHDCTQTLAQQYTPKTIRKHAQLLALFIDCVCWDTDVRRLDESTRGIANSHFRQWYQRKVGDRTASELKHIPSDSYENAVSACFHAVGVQPWAAWTILVVDRWAADVAGSSLLDFPFLHDVWSYDPPQNNLRNINRLKIYHSIRVNLTRFIHVTEGHYPNV